VGKKSRTKGATYEREVAQFFKDWLGVDVKRNLDQSRDGGHDLTEVGGFFIECKRYAKIGVYAWMDQVLAAFRQRGAVPGPVPVPVVICRGDHKESLVVLRLRDLPAIAQDYARRCTPDPYQTLLTPREDC
jgi:hypothetical protein